MYIVIDDQSQFRSAYFTINLDIIKFRPDPFIRSGVVELRNYSRHHS